MLVYIVFAYFAILLVVSITQKKWPVVSYLIGVYTLSLFFSIILYKSDTYYQTTSLWPSFLFCSLLLFYFRPYWKKRPDIVITNSGEFNRRFTCVGYFLSTLLILGSMLFLSKIQYAFSYGLVEMRADMYRDDTSISYSTLEHIGNSTVRWLCGLSYSMIIMFFYSLICIKGKIILKIMLLLSSLSATYIGLLNGGRTYIMYWILFIGFGYFLFWPYLEKKQKYFASILLGGLLAVIGAIFISVTVGRAEMSHEGDAQGFLLNYIGQPYLNFCRFINEMDFHPYTLRRIFPLSSFILDGRFDLGLYRDMIMNHTNLNIGVFFTLLGDIFIDLGYLGLFIYTLVYSFIAKKITKRNSFALTDLLMLGLAFEIPLHGVFYYSMYKMETSFSIVILLFIMRYLRKAEIQH